MTDAELVARGLNPEPEYFFKSSVGEFLPIKKKTDKKGEKMNEYAGSSSPLNSIPYCAPPYAAVPQGNTADQKEKDDLRDLIILYIDSLLKVAIEKGAYIDKPVEDLESITDELRKKIFSPITQPDIVMDGIKLLYATDVAKANARMRQYFEQVQRIPDISEQLNRCYAMLRCVDNRASLIFPWSR